MRILNWFRDKQQASTVSLADKWPLSMPLVRFSRLPADTWTLADSFQGVAIFGENGSGKTSGSGRVLARKYLEAGLGGMVLCFKTDEADLWRSYLRAAGREKDGRFFGVNDAFRFNFLDYEARSSGVDFAENLVTLLVDIASVQKRTEATGSEAHFWLPQKKKLLRNAITLLLLAKESIHLRTLYEMIVSAPKDAQQVISGDWRKQSYVFNVLERAERLASKFCCLQIAQCLRALTSFFLPPLSTDSHLKVTISKETTSARRHLCVAFS